MLDKKLEQKDWLSVAMRFQATGMLNSILHSHIFLTWWWWWWWWCWWQKVGQNRDINVFGSGSWRGHIPVSMSAQVQVVGGNCDHLEIVNITSSTILVLVLVDSSRIISFWQPLRQLDLVQFVNITSSTILVLVLVDSYCIISFGRELRPLGYCATCECHIQGNICTWTCTCGQI